MTKDNIDTFDILKFVLSFFVVAIHAQVFPAILNPVLRTAVPLFFMMSSFFFWKKVNGVSTKKQLNILSNFVKRNLQLYLFWFILLLPVTLKIRNYFEGGIITGLLKILQAFLFYSTFRASWYIVALCIAMIIVFYVSKHIPDPVLLGTSIIFHCIFCLLSNYYGMIEDFPTIINFVQVYKSIFLTLCNSFPVAFIWIVLGKYFAAGRIDLSFTSSTIMLVISILLMYLEQIVILKYSLADNTDCYFYLIPACIAIFRLCYLSKITCKYAATLRKMSTIIYTMHSSAIVFIDYFARNVLNFQNVERDIFVFLVAIICCITTSLVIIKLEKNKHFKWLRWSY